MSDSRARRAPKPVSKAKTSLAQLAELRRTGAKRVHNFELKEEAAVYDEVHEHDYAKLVQDRREEAGGVKAFPEIDEMQQDFRYVVLQGTSLLMMMVWVMRILGRRKTGAAQIARQLMKMG